MKKRMTAFLLLLVLLLTAVLPAHRALAVDDAGKETVEGEDVKTEAPLAEEPKTEEEGESTEEPEIPFEELPFMERVALMRGDDEAQEESAEAEEQTPLLRGAAPSALMAAASNATITYTFPAMGEGNYTDYVYPDKYQSSGYETTIWLVTKTTSAGTVTGVNAICIEPNGDSARYGQTYSDLPNNNPTARGGNINCTFQVLTTTGSQGLLRKLLWYGEAGGSSKFPSQVPNKAYDIAGSHAGAAVLMHVAASALATGHLDGYAAIYTKSSVDPYFNGTQTLRDDVLRYVAAVKDLPDPPATYICTLAISQGTASGRQSYMFTELPDALTGKVTLTKTSSNAAYGNSHSLAGAEFGVYSNQACTTKVGTLTTVAGGTSNTLELTAGTYYVKETKAPTGYKLNTEVKTVTVTAGQTATVSFSDDPGNGYLTLRKTSSDATYGSSHSLAGAEFGVYSNSTCTTKVGTLTTVAGGTSNTLELAAGTYYVKETKAPTGYKLSTEVKSVTVSGGQTATVSFADAPEEGKVTLQKSSSDAAYVNSYSLAGAVFGVYREQACTSEVGRLTTVTGGGSNTLTLPIGTYYVKELTAPNGYLLNTEVKSVPLTTGSTQTVSFTDAPGISRLYLSKKIAPNNSLTAVCPGYYVLDGTEFTVYVGDSSTVAGVLPVSNGKTGEINVTVGVTYRIVETKTMPGFKTAPAQYYTPAAGGKTYSLEIANEPVFCPIVLRLVKENSAKAPLPGAIYTVSYYPEAVTSLEALDGKTAARVWKFRTGSDGAFSLTNGSRQISGNLYTDEAGKAQMLPGSYRFEETEAPDGYAAAAPFVVVTSFDSTGKWSHKSYGGSLYSLNTTTGELRQTDEEQTVTIRIQKTNPDGSTTPRQFASFEGAVYQVIRQDTGEVVGTITTDNEGKGELAGLKPGLYRLHETAAPPAYILNPDDVTVNVAIREKNTPVFIYDTSVSDTPEPIAPTGIGLELAPFSWLLTLGSASLGTVLLSRRKKK